MASLLSIVQGTNTKPASSRALIQFFSQGANASGQLFVGYPIIGTSDGRYPIDALWVSPQKGVIVFDLIEGSAKGDQFSGQGPAGLRFEEKVR